MLILSFSATFVLSTPKVWTSGSGDWLNATGWNGTPPGPKDAVSIEGSANVTISSEAMASTIDVGSFHNSHATLLMTGGSLVLSGILRAGEMTDCSGTFLLKGGDFFATSLNIGGANTGSGTDRCTTGSAEISGGSLIVRHLTLGWGAGSRATLRVVGSKPQRIVATDYLWLGSRQPGYPGSEVVLDFDLDASGVTPITVFARTSVPLAGAGCLGPVNLRLRLLEVPPSGDVTLIQLQRPCSGAFTGLPEGSTVRSNFGGISYEWTISYRAGSGKCDVALLNPRIVQEGGVKIPHTTGLAAQTCTSRVEDLMPAMSSMLKKIEARDTPLDSGTISFPGAGGFGAYAQGGRGGKVIFVSSLNDSGPGTLREALSAKGPRTVIFRVGGVIRLAKGLSVSEPFLTIAGQTAPGDGICVQIDTTTPGDGIAFSNNHDFVIRHLRVQHGKQPAGPGHHDDGGDCISVYGCDNFILDHCSTHWGTDETLSVTGNSDRYTVQWTLIGEGLEYAGHSMGSLLGGGRCTWSHNLWAHCRTRNPRFGFPVRCEFRNNVIYNWGDTAGYGEFARLDYVGNFLRPGPSTTQKPGRFLTGDSFALPGSLFLSGNTIDGCSEIGTDNWLGTGCDKTYAATQPFGPSANRILPVSDALNAVLSGVGATVPHRDAADARLVADVQNRTGKIIRSQEEVGGHPTYPFVRSTVVDSDQDGMPDDWEKSHGLNPNNAADTNLLQPDGYTNLEGYLNSLTFFSR